MQIGTDVKSCYPAIQDIMIGVVNNFPEPDLIFTMVGRIFNFFLY